MTGEGSDSSAGTTNDLVETGGTAKPYSSIFLFLVILRRHYFWRVFFKVVPETSRNPRNLALSET